MAYVQTSRAGARQTADIGAFVGGVSERIRRYRVYRQTLNELGELSTRELSDLGLSRSMVRSIAYKAAYED